MSSIFILPLDFVGMGTNVDGPIGEFGLSHDKLEIVLGHSDSAHLFGKGGILGHVHIGIKVAVVQPRLNVLGRSR
jgi:hypothetical protein